MISDHLNNHIADQFRRHKPDPDLNEKNQIKPMKNDRQR